MSDNEYEQGDAGANDVYPKEGGKVKKGDYLIIKHHPCKVTSLTVSKTGKHGHAKAHVFGNDIFTGRKYEDFFPTSHNVFCPFVKKKQGIVIDVDEDGICTFEDEEEGKNVEIKIEEDELIEKIEEFLEDDTKDVVISIMCAMGQEKVVEVNTKNV